MPNQAEGLGLALMIDFAGMVGVLGSIESLHSKGNKNAFVAAQFVLY